MKVRAELYGKEIGTENNITRAFMEREWNILLTFSTDNKRCVHRMLINRSEAEQLIEQLQASLKQGQDNQFRVV